MLTKFFLGVAFVLALPMTAVYAEEPEIALQVVAFDTGKNDTVTIGFEIENRTSAVRDLEYQLEVYTVGQGEVVQRVDTSTPVTTHVDPRATKRERFSYEAPQYIDGEHSLVLIVRTVDGIPLAGTDVRKVVFSGVSVPVVLDRCRLTTQEAGIAAILPGTPLSVACILKNTGKTDIATALSGEVEFWDRSAAQTLSASDEITLQPGRETLVTLDFPPFVISGRYTGRVYLGTQAMRLSPAEELPVVVAGESAHIAHITLDKDAYQAGETAQATVIVSLESGSQTKNPTVSVSLQDGEGRACADSVEREVESGFEVVNLVVKRACQDPGVSAAIVAASGVSLDTEALTLTSAAPVPSGRLITQGTGVLILGFILLIILAGYLVIRLRRQSPVRPGVTHLGLMFMIAIGSSMTAAVAPVSAATFSGSIPPIAPSDDQRISASGSQLRFYVGSAALGILLHQGNIDISGPISIAGSVTLPGSGGSPMDIRTTSSNRMDFYKGGHGYLGTMIVSGGGRVDSRSNACTQEGHTSQGTGNRWRFSCIAGVVELEFTDPVPPPTCTEPNGPYDTAWCNDRGYDQAVTTCTQNCTCVAPRTWDSIASHCVDPPPSPWTPVDGTCGSDAATWSGGPDPNRATMTEPRFNLCETGSGTVPGNAFGRIHPATGVPWPTWEWDCNGTPGRGSEHCFVFRTAPGPVTTFTGTYAGVTNQTLNLPAGGGTVLLNWSVTNAAGGSCTASASPPFAGWSGARPITGVNVPLNITTTTRLSLDCRNSSGTAASQRSVRVNVATAYVYTYCPASLPLAVGATGQVRLYRRADSTPVDCANPLVIPGTVNLTSLWSTAWSSDLPAVASVSGTGLVSGIMSSALPAYVSALDNGASTGAGIPVWVDPPPPPPPPVPTVDLKINGSDGPLNLTSGATRNFSWTASDATSCTATSGDGWSGAKAVSGSESMLASFTANHTLTCTGPGGTSSDSVQVNIVCVPTNGVYGACDCSTRTKSRTNINAACTPWIETIDCTGTELDSCRDFNWKEVGQ